MAQGRGTALCIGIKRAATWGTSVAVGAAGNGIRPISFSIARSVNGLPYEGFNCDSVPKESSDVGRVSYSGSFTCDMKNEGLTTAVALAMGTGGTPTTVSSNYRHDLYRKIDHSEFFTLCWDDGYKTWEIDSAIMTGLKFSGTANGAILAEFSWTGRALDSNTATNANLTSLTENAAITRWLYDDTADYKIGVQGAAADAEFECMEWEWGYTRELDIENAYSNINGKWMRQPQAGGSSSGGSIKIPHSSNTTLLTVLTKATQEMFFLHTATTLVNEGGLYLPSVTFDDGEHNVEGFGSVMQTLSFTTNKADALPTGYLQLVPYVSIHNATATDPLA